MGTNSIDTSVQALQNAELVDLDPSSAIRQAEAAEAERTSKEQPGDDPAASQVSANPLEAIAQEVEKAKLAPKHVGLLSVKSANAWIESSLRRPDPRTFFKGLIVEFENTVIFASSNVGKSIFSIQIAEEIARTEKVLVVDLELSEKQFEMRYTDKETGQIHVFPDNFLRAEIDPELIVGADLEEEILASIEEAAKQGVRFVFVDNITFICNDSEKAATASSFMMKLIRLKKKYNLTTIVIAHTPKRRGYEPITQNDLAGSAKLISFFDAGIAIARSAKDNNIRYVKQVKVRTGEFLYDSENVMIYDVNKTDGFLRFEFQDYGKEDDHLKSREGSDDVEEIMEILQLQKDGKTLRDIAKILEMSLGKVQRRLKKAKDNNITLEDNAETPVSDCIGVSETTQAIQTIQADTVRLPFKDEED